jgi:NAD(P)-dependent dehydrogenase (short-subunit alcohol dehydrogenase family)
VNNAGIVGPQAPLHEIPVDEFDKTIGVDLRGVFLCMSAEIQQMIKQGGDNYSIVNTSSVMGLRGNALTTAYCTAKHGVIGMTKSAALDYAKKGIRVNAMCPGMVDTGMVPEDYRAPEVLSVFQPISRIIRTEEIASSVLFLLSDEARAITGMSMNVDGGWLAK